MKLAQEEEGTRVAATGSGTLRGDSGEAGNQGLGRWPGHVGRKSWIRGPRQGRVEAGGPNLGVRGEGREKGPWPRRKGRGVLGN